MIVLRRVKDMNTTKEISKIANEKQNPETIPPVIKERLKVIASIIVERIMEDQQNGILRFKSKLNT